MLFVDTLCEFFHLILINITINLKFVNEHVNLLGFILAFF